MGMLEQGHKYDCTPEAPDGARSMAVPATVDLSLHLGASMYSLSNLSVII